MNILAIVIALSVIAQIGFVNSVHAVELIPLNGTNSTLNQGLPIFYDCIDKAVEQSVNVTEDEYFKEEPTKNEVITCYNEVLVDANGLDKTNVQNEIPGEPERAVTPQLLSSQEEQGEAREEQEQKQKEGQVAPSVPFFQ
jgi:hypothetical protein